MVTFFPGVSIRFAVDGLSCIFALVATFLWFFATSYNIGYMQHLSQSSRRHQSISAKFSGCQE